MEYKEWRRFYNAIREELKLSEAKDRKSAEMLNSMIAEQNTEKIAGIIRKNIVNIFGAGPNLEKVRKIPSGRGIKNIACDGAASYLLELKCVPDIIISDLDGKIEDIIKAEKRGSTVMIHAHGDNIDKIAHYAGKFSAPFGTTQLKPFGKLFNFGGFTDGDRAVFIAEHFKPEEINLYGFDFSGKIGKYSFTERKDVERKRKKLKWAERLVNYLKAKSEVPIRFAEINFHF